MALIVEPLAAPVTDVVTVAAALIVAVVATSAAPVAAVVAMPSVLSETPQNVIMC